MPNKADIPIVKHMLLLSGCETANKQEYKDPEEGVCWRGCDWENGGIFSTAVTHHTVCSRAFWNPRVKKNYEGYIFAPDATKTMHCLCDTLYDDVRGSKL